MGAYGVDELRRRRQWLAWQYKTRASEPKPTKVPLGSTTDRNTWNTYNDACYVAQFLIKKGTGGVGFVFSADDPYVGVDLDHCVADGVIHPAAQAIIDRLDGYSELSPSATGVHIIVRGELPGGVGNRGTGAWGGAIEIYDRARFFTFSGDGQGEIADRTDQLQAVAREYLPERADAEIDWDREPASDFEGTDDELLAVLRDDARFARLYCGEHGDDWSAADFKLCAQLAEVVGNDPRRIERLWASSGLAKRAKFEREDYRRSTITRAIAGQAQARVRQGSRVRRWD